jgi:hypothetical protein
MRKLRSKLTPEHIAFIKENIAGCPYSELTELFNARFGTAYSKSQIKDFAVHRKFRNGLDRLKLTPEQIAFIKENIAGCPYSELTELLNARFGTAYGVTQIRDFAVHRKFHTGTLEKYPINTEHEQGGYIRVKTGPRRWRNKHVLIWEAANGPVPKGCAVIFADGNKRNFALENLLLVSKGEFGMLNHEGLISGDAEQTKTGLALAKLTLIIHKRKREPAGRKKHPRTEA